MAESVPPHSNVLSDGRMLCNILMFKSLGLGCLRMLPHVSLIIETGHAQDIDGEHDSGSQMFSPVSGPMQTVPKAKYFVDGLLLFCKHELKS